MATTTTAPATAPYVLFPAAFLKQGITGVQDSITFIQKLLEGGSSDDRTSPAEIIRTRKEDFARNAEYLSNVLVLSDYDGFVNKTLIKEYLDLAKATFDPNKYTMANTIYGTPVTYTKNGNEVQIAINPTYTITMLDSLISATEGQDLVFRAKLNTKNHNGVKAEFSFSIGPSGTQFLQNDVVIPSSRGTTILPLMSFAPGTDYAEVRLSTVDDSMREVDEQMQILERTIYGNALNPYDVKIVGSPIVTILDNDWVPTISNLINNITNVTVTGNNNTVNVSNTNVISGTDGADELIGVDANETIKGGFGADVLKGGLGDDTLIGNQDNDQLFGGEGADVLWGGLGDDLLCPNQGNDIVYGNMGADKFILCKGQDTIKDFNFIEGDRLLVFGDTTNVSYGMSAVGNLEVRRGTDITTLEGVTFANFDPMKAVLGMG
jgi:Ca2+-binding RTX toxin-like protein